MEKIVISAAEVARAEASPDVPTRFEPRLEPAVPGWAKWTLSPLVLLLPLLCLVAIVLRLAMRTLPPRNRYAWSSFLSTLLIVSGMLTSVATVLAFSFAPLPSLVGAGLGELDEQTNFPALPSASAMSAREVSEKLKPLVAVISPARRSWFTREEMPSSSFGAGALLQATPEGYLFITARHVIDGARWNEARTASQGLITMASGGWGGAEVVGRHRNLDLLLLWVRREYGTGSFVQPLAASAIEGASIFVIGHPEGLRFTLSTGIISRLQGSTLQISAPVSPGNSGGPVFDDRGELLGIVTSMVDKHGDPNAENLNFAVSADALLHDSGWEFSGVGKRRLNDFIAQGEQRRKSLPVDVNH